VDALAADPDCVFCAVVSGTAPAHVVHEDDHVVAFLDRQPLFHGHTLVVPRDHHVTLADLPGNQVGPYFAAVQRLARAVQAATGSAGTFVAMNNTVSQSVPHLHTHVVPRNRKDGLKGFFWPRTRYDDDDHMARVAAQVRAAIDA
jgi:histidine triad (HIT) family protein